jgi:hypothetical protein
MHVSDSNTAEAERGMGEETEGKGKRDEGKGIVVFCLFSAIYMKKGASEPASKQASQGGGGTKKKKERCEVLVWVLGWIGIGWAVM